ncbi:genetic suppressor element 1 isoform X2 [Octopus bimaculoides]|uniref:genetic suppressor element 1 isoform X2 n=1 Tax=Octopus bimaculoides TaxID=37653 RepID=UPI00071CCB2F|nr:genetic suppressor element 1 isoform X2 [Octopus bimaculoides]|eukprot:XP_014770320.1 PREDICTED: genetic suppressor element 1-like isoform X2 [Octopus bimaculoides]
MGSRTVCFVCGNLGADSGRILYTKPRLDKGPYFPFLEDHEPPKGARLLGADGTVDSCRVCHAFLTQQWDTYERNKTPSVKRLYWLKRSDNGQFTGAEMRLQGEYIAQVMGLQYNPGSVDSGFNSSSPNVTKSRLISLADPYAALDTRGAAADVALDLSVHKNNGHSSSSSRDYRSNNTDEVTNFDPHAKSNSSNATTVTDKCRSSSSSSSSSAKYVCFTCGALQPWITRRFIFAFRQPSGDPYFPFLTRFSTRAGAAPLSDKGIAAVCNICRRTLYQQWKDQEMANISIENRTYRINKEKYPDTKDNICISSSINAGGSSSSSNSSHVSEKTLSGSNNNTTTTTSSTTNKEICYLCGQFMSHSSSRLLHTLTKDSRSNMMHFPFIRDLPRPEGAHPLNPDGTVIACRVCVDHLATQWHMYESQGVKLSQRQFTLPINLNRATYTYQSSDSSNFPTSEGDVSQPLNIQITSGSPVPTVPTGSQGLLAIATSITSSSTAHNNGEVSNRSNVSSVYSNQFPSSSSSTIDARRVPVDMKPNLAALDNSLNINNNNSSSSNTIIAATIPHPLQCVSSLPKKVCFLCGESGLVANMHVLCSYPARHDAKVPNGQTNPFFPFLANRDPAQGAETMSDEGTVMSCQYCYHMLLKQWKDYENCKTPGTSNRWLRKYVLKNFTCYVCSRTAERKKICTLQVPKFPFLKDHKVPQGALVMDSGESVVVCKGCSRSLHRQFTEFERMGLRLELRKYNWIQPPGGDDSMDEQHSQTDENGPTPLNSSSHGGDGHDNQSSAADLTTTTASTHWPSSSHAGLPQGAKPPPLTMVNSGASKVTRNTATVQPLSQVSSSPSNSVTSISGNAALNATRTSSFAAALRKLANQAKDPDDGPSVKAVPTTSVSPRSSTPKRGPPPLVYSSQSSSSSYLTPPPVVTIAPTQAHPTHLHSEAHSQNLERTHSVQSSSSSLYDPLTIKQERDHRPLSSQSRDGDTAKECIIQPSHRTTSSALSSSSSTHGRDDLPPRGFQPYRPEEEIRPMLTSPFGLDAAYPYHPALFAHQPYPHPAFSRIDDPLVLERCRLMHPHFMTFPPPGIIPPPGVHPFLSSSRYPTDLLHQQYPQYLPNSSRLAGYRSPGPNDRSRADDEKIKRIDSDREIEREKERERELERQKEFEQREQQQQEKERLRELERQHQLERQHDADRRKSEVNYMREEERRHTLQQSDSTYSGSITQGTPRDLLYVERLAPSQNSSNGLPEQGHHSQRGRRTPYESGDHCSSSSSNLMSVASHQLKQEQEVHPTSRHSTSPAMHLEDRRKHHSYLTKNDFTIPRLSKEQSSNVSNSNSSSHSSNQKSSDKHHDTQDDRRSVKPPPLVAPVRSGPNSETDKNSESGLFRPYDVLHPYRYPSHPYPDSHKAEKINSYDSNSGRSSSNNRSNEQSSLTKHEPPSEGPSRQRNTQEEFQFDINSSICSQVVNKAHPPELPNHYSSYFRSGGFYDRSLSVHINSVVDASFHIFPDQNLVSKLDLEEAKMRESRLNGTYCSDSEEDEELTVAMEMERKQQLCIITTNPPLALDKSPSKMRYLKSMGLTTHSRRRDLEFDRYRKRRHMFREGSLSPVSTPENNPEPVTKLTVPPVYFSEQLCMQNDYKQKCRYLHSFLLTPLTGDKKKEYEAIRQACEEEKARRLGLVLENVLQPQQQQQQQQQPDEERLLSEPVKRSKPALLDSLHRRVKRKSTDMEGSSQVSNKLEQPSRPKISLNQLQERHLAATASSSSSSSSSSSTSSQPHYLKQTSVSTLPSVTPSLQMANPSRTSQENTRPLIFPENRGDSRDQRRLKEKFAQEFHESVLASTFSNKSSNGRTGMKSVDSSRDNTVTHLSAVSSILQQSQKSSSHDSHSSLCSRSDDGRLEATDSFNGQPLFKWPGIETILGTYQRYLEEQRLERHILNDRCQKLKTDNIDLNRTAEKLSRKVSNLLESKNHDDEELCRMRNSVDALRRYCLQLPR